MRLRAFPRLSGFGRPGHLALTFDDGPDPTSTPALLTELDRLGWRATFFQLGFMADRDPGLAAEVAAAGHEIALHGYDHRNHLLRGPLAVLGDLRRGLDAVATATATTPVFFRPPYGVLSTAGWISASLVGVRPVLWGAWGRDWMAEAGAETVLATLRDGISRAQNAAPPERIGITLLLHDSDCTSEVGSWRSARSALAPLAEWAAAGGWTVGPLAEHGL